MLAGPAAALTVVVGAAVVDVASSLQPDIGTSQAMGKAIDKKLK